MNEAELQARVVELEERLEWMTMARDNLAANRDEVQARSKHRGRVSGRIIGAMKTLFEEFLPFLPADRRANAAERLREILRDRS